MLDVIADTLLDSIKLLPFLFLTYLAMEYLEHRTSSKTKRLIKDSGKAGPFLGALLGAFPQCGWGCRNDPYHGRRGWLWSSVRQESWEPSDRRSCRKLHC